MRPAVTARWAGSDRADRRKSWFGSRPGSASERRQKTFQTGFRRKLCMARTQSFRPAKQTRRATCGAACADLATLYATPTPSRATNAAPALLPPALLTLMRDGKRAMSEGWLKEKNPVRSTVEEFAGPVEPAKRQSGLCEGLGGTFFAIDHGQDQRHLGSGLARRLHSLERRVTGGGDVLDNRHALALEGLVFRQSLHRKPGSMLLWLLAHEEGCDRMALDPGQLRHRACERHRAHFQTADRIETVVLERLIGQFRKQRRA